MGRGSGGDRNLYSQFPFFDSRRLVEMMRRVVARRVYDVYNFAGPMA